MATRIEAGVGVDELALELEPDRKDSREADNGLPDHEWADGDEFPIPASGRSSSRSWSSAMPVAILSGVALARRGS